MEVRTPTTTHAGWGAGHPRLLIAGDDERYVHEIVADVTRIGSSTDADVLLIPAEPLHATVTHDATDEYVLTMLGEGETNVLAWTAIGADSGHAETLRTGAHFTVGRWRLVFARDEFADHGRPYGGREGGEGAHQRRQPPRPDYAGPHPAAVGPAGFGRAVLADESEDTADGGPRVDATDLRVVDDEAAGFYVALVDDREVGAVTYNRAGEDRLVLLAVSVLPEFRGRGIASALIRRVLDEARARGTAIVAFCPVVRAYVERHPRYADLLDPEWRS